LEQIETSQPSSTHVSDPVLAVGFPTSGTTLLRFMLNAHPEIGVLPEGTYIDDLMCCLGDGICTVDDMAKIDGIIRAHNKWSLCPERVSEAVRERLPAHVSRVIEVVYRNWGEQVGKSPRFWGAKGPHHTAHFERLIG